VRFHTERKNTMPMSELERKAAFKYACTVKRTTMKDAAREVMGVGYHHLTEGLGGRRPLSTAVEERFAAFIGSNRAHVFGASTTGVAA
jgi:hypothetical protein